MPFMKLRYLILTMLFTLRWAVAPAAGVVQLSSLTNSTLQDLINMGSTPVAVGPYQFSNFSFIDASSGAAQTAAQVKVMSFATGGFGLQFVTNWFAADGSLLDEVIAYDVTTTDPTQAIGRIDLFSNSTAPAPANGTFTSTTLASQVPGGQTASPVLSTYNDGFTSPVDTTKPDVNYTFTSLVPQDQLHIIDTYIAISTPANGNVAGGVTTASVLQNTFVPVPEPAKSIWILLLPIGLTMGLSRPRRQGPGLV